MNYTAELNKNWPSINEGFLKASLCLQRIITSVILVINRLWADITQFFFVSNTCLSFIRMSFIVGVEITIGGSRGVGDYESASPPGPISFIVMQFSVKILPNNRFSPQRSVVGAPSVQEILDPPLITSFRSRI